ncbi:MAG: hypothetical protein ACODAG_04300 [Myxococcota bacterium]
MDKRYKIAPAIPGEVVVKAMEFALAIQNNSGKNYSHEDVGKVANQILGATYGLKPRADNEE